MFPVFFYFAFVRGEILKTHIQNLVKGDSKARIHALKCIESEGFVASVGNAAQRDERVIPAVVGALVEDKNPEVRSEAQATLVRLGSRTDNRSVFHRVIRDELKLHDEYDASAVNEVLQRIGPDPLEMD
ncbi:hypothetical protein CKO51_31380 [Rhodopirellula sp. SM50]|nr:hypothetical protein CKO51_31380 [Rhodopirellula sp. SM50]